MSQGQEVAIREATQSAIAQFQDPEFVQQVTLAVPDGVSSRQLLRVAATAVLENPKLAAPALRASLLQATLKLAPYGLLPDGRQAAFVIYKTKQGEKVQSLVMIDGVRAIAADYGWAIQTAVVYANDQFDPEPEEGKAHHKPTPLNQARGEPIGAYAVAQHRDGRRMLEVMNLTDIEKVRQTSRAKDVGPWVDWWERMAEKTVGKRMFKKLSLDPKDKRVAGILQALEDEDPADALYGPSGEPPEDADWHDSPAPVDEELNEPSDEELAALGADDIPFGTASEETAPVFDAGKFKGFTVSEVYANGNVGIGYLKWALREWKEGPLKDSLVAFASEHPELEGEQQ